MVNMTDGMESASNIICNVNRTALVSSFISVKHSAACKIAFILDFVAVFSL